LAFPLVPSYVADSIFDLTPGTLRAKGIRLVLADLDNTLVSYEDALPSPAVYVVSNSRKSRRCPDFCAALGVPCVRHAGKPGRAGFRRALREAGVKPQEAVMVGDQIFTDVLGANRAGVASILVKPIAIGKNPLRAARYAAETPFRLAGKRKDTL